MERPEKMNVMLAMAHVISSLSHDSQTKHGCVITDDEYRILGVGYNGFPRGCKNDDKLPTTRPDKYPWMIHSEQNAVLNCEHRPKEGIAYVTGLCCHPCLTTMWQAGIKTVYQVDRDSFMVDREQDKLKRDFLEEVPMTVHTVRPDYSFLLPLIADMDRWGFVHHELKDSKAKFEEFT